MQLLPSFLTRIYAVLKLVDRFTFSEFRELMNTKFVKYRKPKNLKLLIFAKKPNKFLLNEK